MKGWQVLLTITVTKNVSTTVLSLKGELDYLSVDDLSVEIISSLVLGNQLLAVDLTKVKAVDFHAAATLRGLIEFTAPNYDGEIKLIVTPGSKLCQQLESLGVADWANYYPQVRDALESFFS